MGEERTEPRAVLPGAGVPNAGGIRCTTDAKPGVAGGDGCPAGTSRCAGETGEDIRVSHPHKGN